LLSLIVMPLYIPVLIFGASAVSYALDTNPQSVPLAILGALLALSLALSPVATAAALRMSTNA
jgi:heme exporter protein B